MANSTELTILFSADGSAAIKEINGVDQSLNRVRTQADKTAQGWDWNKREVMQMSNAMRGAAFAMGDIGAGARILVGVTGELNERLAEAQMAGKGFTASLKGMMGGLMVSGGLMAASIALEEWGKRARENLDIALKYEETLARLARSRFDKQFSADIDNERRLYEAKKITFTEYQNWLDNKRSEAAKRAQELERRLLDPANKKDAASISNELQYWQARADRLLEIEVQNNDKRLANDAELVAEREQREFRTEQMIQTAAGRRMEIHAMEASAEVNLANETMKKQLLILGQGEQQRLQVRARYAQATGQLLGQLGAALATGEKNIAKQAAISAIGVLATELEGKLAMKAAAAFPNIPLMALYTAAIAGVEGAKTAAVSAIQGSGGGAIAAPTIPMAGISGSTPSFGSESGNEKPAQVNNIYVYGSLWQTGELGRALGGEIKKAVRDGIDFGLVPA